MKNFLQHIGFEKFTSIYVGTNASDSQAPYFVECLEWEAGTIREITPRLIIQEHSEDGHGTVTSATVDLLRRKLASQPVVLYNRRLTLAVLNQQARQLLDQRHSSLPYFDPQGLDVLEMARILAPMLVEYDLSSLERAFERALAVATPQDTSTAALLAEIFCYLLECLMRVDLARLGILSRLLKGSKQSFALLCQEVYQYKQHNPRIEFANADFGIAQTVPGNEFLHKRQPHTAGLPASSDLQNGMEVVFGEDGLLSSAMDAYEYRPEQEQLAKRIAEAFTHEEFVVTEAGTGVGKTLAYLAPAILWDSVSEEEHEPVVVSTQTKNLQDQLFYKDLPAIAQVLNRDLRAVLLKGRNNYLCIERWRRLLSEPAKHLSRTERYKILPIFFWRGFTQTGDISECAGFDLEENLGLWSKLASESSFCQAYKCNQNSECFVKQLKDRARKAHLKVVNHALLLSDLVSNNSILDDYKRLIVDEAHHLDKTAYQHLGAEFSMGVLRYILNQFHEVRPIKRGVFEELRLRSQHCNLPRSDIETVMQHLEQVLVLHRQLFDQAEELFGALRSAAEVASQKEAYVSGNSDIVVKVRFTSETATFSESAEKDRFFDAIAKFAHATEQIVNMMKDWTSEDIDQVDEMRQHLILKTEELLALIEHFEFILAGDDRAYVYWFELGKRSAIDIKFHAVPLNVGDILRERLYEGLKTCVFSSATMSVAGSHHYFKNKVGLGSFDETIVGDCSVNSPFDYDTQARLLIPAFIPEPAHADYGRICQSLIEEIVLRYRCGTLILFTAYQLLNRFYDGLREPFEHNGITLLAQGRMGSRSNITQRFRADRTSVLLGTDSFWQGVDVVGAALELLVITKLPFDVPNDPLVQAKSQALEEAGGNAFWDYMVPEGVLRLKQGFGRLIRSKADAGVMLMLDTRVIKKNYGKYFLEGLPLKPDIIETKTSLFQAMDEFLIPLRHPL